MAADDNVPITCEIKNNLARLVLNRPEKLNALDGALFKLLNRHLQVIEESQVDCVLLSGNGRSFCAGHNLECLASGTESGAVERFENGVVERLACLPMPVVAAVQGHCFTGGLELVLGAEIIIASDDALFADTHSKFDLVPIWGLTQRLPRRVGQAKALEMMFSAKRYNAAEAEKMGLVNFVVQRDQLAQAADAFCQNILANSARSNRAIKKIIHATDGLNLAAGNAWELHHSPGHGPNFAEHIARRLNEKKS